VTPFPATTGPDARSFWLTVAVLTVTLVVVISLALRYQFGSARAVLLYARGKEIVLGEDRIDLGPIPRGGTRTFTIRVVNNAGQPRHVIGTNNLCNCTVLSPLPAEVPAWGSLPFEVRLTVPYRQDPGPTYCVVELVSDAPAGTAALAQVVGYDTR
jgi:hypothetical protein